MSFAGRLVLGATVVFTLALLILLWGAERAVRGSLEGDARAALEREHDLAGELLGADPATWQSTLDLLSRRTGYRFVLEDTDGRRIAASDSLTAERLLHVNGPHMGGVLRVTGSLERVDAAVDGVRGAMTSAALLALLLTMGIAAIAARSVVNPLVQLSAAARAIAAGETPRFPRSPIPEVEGLAQSLRQTHRELADRFDQIQREKAASTAIVQAMSDGIIASDAAGRIVIANPAARRLLSYQPDAPLPPLQTLFRAKAARDAVTEVLEGRVVQDREVERDGRILAINARSIEGAGAVVVLRDLTEVRRLEAVRRDFVANVSHELKTPLTSISGYAETLTGADVSTDDQRRFLTTILANATRMQTLVDDLLDLSRIESGRWTPRPESVRTDAAAHEAWLMVADKALAKQARLTTEIAPGAETVVADPSALRQILTNLFDNAVRYVDTGGQITLRVTPIAGAMRLAVVDDGSGIPAEHLPRIFERFYRVDPSRSREAGGTGLGLAIVRHMVEAHGGRVTVESVLRRGTTVVLELPVQPD